ncbi:DKNYY domain-containing protein [Leptotrichia sp. oral taxon 223]|uniref:DKNYY domain-containing protein n=1 Tax=Leptotrichia sp. oral taxon 223 TaxID=712363 RepID=UPI0015BD2100|nr:DKNYY domain-containing protein [Leptotrichia sp. oral taxon 223]NWO20034.1 DKNYY domain-containing protein [Leptotrichia sp. oral taxon 223]
MKNKIFKIFVIMVLVTNVSYAKNNVKIDKATFQEIAATYSKDKNGVYVWENRGWKKLEELDPITFQIINVSGSVRQYLKDKNGIYSIIYSMDGDSDNLVLEKLPYDSQTFEVINKLYTRDKNNIYYSDRKIIGADLSTFQIGSDGFSKDKNNIYFGGKRILGIDKDTVKIIELPYIEDKNNVYYGNKKIEGADKNTFELTYDFKSVVNGYYSKDKNNVYYENKKLKGIDVKTFKKINRLVDNFLIEDKNGFYIVEKDGSIAPIDGKKVDIENLSQLAIKTNLYHDKDSMYFVKNHKLVKIKDAPKVDPYNLSTYNNKYINKYDVVYYLDTDEGAFKKLEKAESHQFSAYGDTEYAKGRRNVYFKGKVLTGADYASFDMKYNHEKDVYEIKDKNKVYETVKAD